MELANQTGNGNKKICDKICFIALFHAFLKVSFWSQQFLVNKVCTLIPKKSFTDIVQKNTILDHR